MQNDHLVKMASKTGKQLFIVTHKLSGQRFPGKLLLQGRHEVIDRER